jgi:iron(III) transport system substrate-binding protein
MNTKGWGLKPLLAACMVTLIALTAACSSSSEPGATSTPATMTGPLATVAPQAAQEGQVVWYTAYSDDVIDAVQEAWGKEHPDIRLDAVRIGTGEMSTRFSGETSSGVHTADVLTIGDSSMLRDNADWFTPLTKDLLPSLVDYPADDQQGGFLSTNLTAQVIHYNTDTVTEADAPKTWRDIADPKWKGQCIMVDPRSFPGAMSWAKQLRDAYGDDFMRQVAAQGCSITDSGVPGVQELAAGAHALSYTNVPGHSKQIRAQKGPVAVAYMTQPPYPAQAHYLAIPAQAPHPNAARIFAEWLISASGQEVACLDVYNSENPKALGCLPAPTNGKPEQIENIPQAEQDELVSLLGLS